jgi:hypothetical protein
LDELEKRIQAAGEVRDPIRVVVNPPTGEMVIVDGLGRWEIAKRTHIEPRFENLGVASDVDVAAVILDYATRRNLSAEQKVRLYLDLQEHSDQWRQDREQARESANASRSESAKLQPRGEAGHFETRSAGTVSHDTIPVRRQRDRIAAATGTSPATVARVLATRSGHSKQSTCEVTLRRLLSTAIKALASAAILAAKLNAGEIAKHLEELTAQAGRVHAAVDGQVGGRSAGSFVQGRPAESS